MRVLAGQHGGRAHDCRVQELALPRWRRSGRELRAWRTAPSSCICRPCPASPTHLHTVPNDTHFPTEYLHNKHFGPAACPQAMRTSWLSELSGPTTPALLAAEAQSVRYWRTNALAFRDRVLDGFYEPHGLFPEVCAPEHFPHLSALMRVIPQRQPEASILRREVILVDRRRDKHLQAMAAEAAEAVARARGPDEIGSPTRRSGASGGSADNKAAAPANKAAPAAVEPTPIADSLPCYQALAHVVAGHMGGTLVRWLAFSCCRGPAAPSCTAAEGRELCPSY